MIEMLMSEAAEVVADDLGVEINEAWQGLADAVFSPDFIVTQFRNMLDNPLILAITSALLVVAGFHIFARAVSIFISKYSI